VSGEQGSWLVQLAGTAQSDYDEILLWTLEHFDERQMRAYSEVMDQALEALVDGLSCLGVRARDDISPGLFSLHVARNKHKGRHVILFRADHRRHVIDVLRILHDAMDFQRHLPRKPS